MKTKKFNSDLDRFKNFYKNPNQEDYNYFKSKYIKSNKVDPMFALLSIMNNLDFEKVDEKTIRIVENQIDLDSLHPIIQNMIKAYLDYVKTIQ